MTPAEFQANLSNKFPEHPGLIVSTDEEGGNVAVHLGDLDLGLGSPASDEEWEAAEEKAITMIRTYLSL
jgi:hypothetical protein